MNSDSQELQELQELQEPETLRRQARPYNIAAFFLLMLGLSQMAGYLTGLPALRGLGAASAAAPFPKVFSAIKGYETFAADFAILCENEGATVRIPITPERYQHLRGPYNRRNVYGAALSYGPRLPRDLWEAVFRYGLRPGGALRTELGIPASATSLRVEIHSRTKGREEVWVLEPRGNG